MDKCFVRKSAAYFTVEAAMVLTATMGVVILLVYIIFLQYDRCLLEMDMGSLALKGCALQEKNNDDLLKKLVVCEREIYWDKYIAWESAEACIEINGSTVRVEQKGYLKFPFTKIMSQDEESLWQVYASYENCRVSPVVFLRTCRKLKGGK